MYNEQLPEHLAQEYDVTVVLGYLIIILLLQQFMCQLYFTSQSNETDKRQ